MSREQKRAVTKPARFVAVIFYARRKAGNDLRTRRRKFPDFAGRRLMITSTANAQMKYLVRLQEKGSARREDRVYVCEGRKLFREVLQLSLIHI